MGPAAPTLLTGLDRVSPAPWKLSQLQVRTGMGATRGGVNGISKSSLEQR